MKSIPYRIERARYIRRLDGFRTGKTPRPVALTCKGKTDGAGAQIQAQLSTIVFCRSVGISYLHTPLSTVEHTSSPAEIEAWEKFLNLSEFSEIDDVDAFHEMHLSEVVRSRELPHPGVLASVQNMHAYLDRYPHLYEAILPRIRENAFRGNNHALPSRARLALHVRRGDVAPTHQMRRYTSNGDLVARLRAVMDRFPEIAQLDGPMRLYSQGTRGDFSDILAAFPDIELHLDTDPIDTIRALANAQFLIIGKSSFSYLAALLCTGTVIYEPFWHRPLPNWISLDVAR